MNFSTTRSRAKSRGIPFTLSKEEFESLVVQPCTYCGAEEPIGLDRMNSRGPYSLENVVPACTFCNTLRGAMPHRTWVDFLRCVAAWYVYDGREPDPGRPARSYYRGR